jgi:hypothetical protein
MGCTLTSSVLSTVLLLRGHCEVRIFPNCGRSRISFTQHMSREKHLRSTYIKKVYSFCLMVEASDHGYVLHTRRIHGTRYRIRYDIRFTGMKVRYSIFERVTKSGRGLLYIHMNHVHILLISGPSSVSCARVL